MQLLSGSVEVVLAENRDGPKMPLGPFCYVLLFCQDPKIDQTQLLSAEDIIILLFK